MAKTFQVSFKINGALDGSLQAALQAAANSMRGLGNAARQASAAAQASRGGLAGLAAGLNQLQQAAQKYKAVQDALKQTTADMSKATANLRSAREKYAADTAAVEKLKAKLDELKNTQSQLGTKKSAGNASLKQLRQDLQGLKQAYAEAKRAGDQMKMSTLASQIQSTQGAIAAQKAKVKEMADEYKKLSAQIKQTKTDLSAATAAQSTSRGNLSSAQTDAQRLAASYKSQQAALASLKASLSSAGFNVSNFAASESRLAGDIDRVNAALRQQQALSSAQANSNAASQNMTMAGANFMGAIATAQQVAAPFQAAIDNAMTFEHSMSRVKALTQTGNIMAGKTAEVEANMAKLEAQARELGSTTQFTMTQAADAMGYLGMAGWKTEQIYGTMPGMLNLAAGAGTDLARTADIVSDNMTAMGVPVEKAGHFMDVYAYALTNSNVNLESLGETMKYAAPVAAAFGATLEDTAAMTMMMGNAGIKGSMAGTALRMGLLRLSGPPKKASKALDEMGVSVSDATAMAMEAEAELARLGVQYDKNAAPMDKMQTIITQLSGKMANMSAEEKLASVSAIFGANAASGWINILEQGPEVFNEYLNSLRNCDGYSEQFAKTMNDDTRGAMIALESAMDAVSNSIGSALLPAVRSAAEAFTPIASGIAIFIQEHPGVIQACAAIAAAFTTVIVGAAAVKLAFAGWTFITSTITLVQTALASLGSGAMFGGLIARIAAVRTAMLSLTATGGLATSGGWATLFAGISTKATAAATAIRTFFATMTLGSAASGIATTISSIGTAIAGAGRAAMAFALSPVGVALMALALAGMYCYQNWEKVGPVFSNIAGIVTGALGSALASIQPAIQGVMTAFESLGSGGAIQGLINTLGGGLVMALASVATVIASTLATVINVISNIATAVTGVVTGIVNTVSNILSGNWSAAWESAKSAAEAALNGIKGVAESVLNGIATAVEGIGSAWNAIFGDKPATPDVPSQPANQPAQQAVTQAVAAAPAPEAQPIDTSQTQVALDQVGSSAQNAATNLQGVDQASTGVQQLSTNAQQASTGVQQIATGAQQAATAVQQDASAMQAHSADLSANGAALQGNIGALDAFGAAAQGACGGVQSLGTAAGSAAGSVGSLAGAVQSACAALASAGASAAAAASAGAAKNAQGGIYKKGAFLTTFAEESPEAAIPLDKSQRAIGLWQQAGQMLGQLPGNGNAYDAAPKDELGNVQGLDIPEYNRIKTGDSEDVKIDKRRVQGEQLFAQQMAAKYAAEQIQQATAQAASVTAETVTTETIQAVSEAAASTNYSDIVTDELGNIQGLDIPEFNRIKADDYIQMKQWKAEAQREQLEAQRQAARQAAEQIQQTSTLPPEVQTAQATASQTATSPLLPRNRRLSAASERRLRQPLPDTSSIMPSNQRGSLEGLTSGLSPKFSGGGENMTFNASFNVNINGQANADEVQRGIEQAIPSLDDWARQFAAVKHEEARRSFA